MRQYISQEEMETTLEHLNSKMDQESHQEEVERIKRAKGTNTPLGYRTTSQWHVLWSDGTGDKTFQNSHRCWPLSKAK